MKIRFLLSFFIACLGFLSVPRQGVCEDMNYQEGVFQVNISSDWTRMPDEMLSEMREVMIGGGRDLAESSNLADPNDINEKAIPFVSGFQLQRGDKRILLTFSGVDSPVVMDREEMFETNTERVQWGIDTGRLKKTSKGVSKLELDGIPCLLQDIETQQGGRMQMYSFFIPEHPKMLYSVQIICDDKETWDAQAEDLSAIIEAIKVVRKTAQ